MSRKEMVEEESKEEIADLIDRLTEKMKARLAPDTSTKASDLFCLIPQKFKYTPKNSMEFFAG